MPKTEKESRRGIIEFCALTDYPLNNMNSDEFGRPKSAVMGDALRVYFSAQSKKRAMRTNDIFEELVGERATRTRRFPNIIYFRLIECGMPEEAAAATAVSVAGKSLDKKPKDEKNDSFLKMKEALANSVHIGDMAYMSQREIDDIVEAALDIFNDEDHKGNVNQYVKDFAYTKNSLNKIAAWCKKKCKDEPHPMTADQALFGRMVTNVYPESIESALKVAPSIQIHASSINNDYITAVEEIMNDEGDAGSGHITSALFTSGIYFTYMYLDLDQLYENFAGAATPEEQEELYVATACVVPLLIAFSHPNGRQSNFASSSIPDFLMAVHKHYKHAVTPYPAFHESVRNMDMPEAIEKMAERCEKTFNTSVYNKPKEIACVCLQDDVTLPEDFVRQDSLDDLCTAIGEWIRAEK